MHHLWGHAKLLPQNISRAHKSKWSLNYAHIQRSGEANEAALIGICLFQTTSMVYMCFYCYSTQNIPLLLQSLTALLHFFILLGISNRQSHRVLFSTGSSGHTHRWMLLVTWWLFDTTLCLSLQSSRAHITRAVLEQFLCFAKYLDGLTHGAPLLKQLCDHILFNAAIWIHTPAKVSSCR